MNTQRLKHAWARGARIELRINSAPDARWLPAVPDRLKWPAYYDFRIHPDDEHLQYGPVSSAFRDMALFTDIAPLAEEVELFLDLAGSNWPLEISGTASNVEIDFCRLFFAEYLADMGL